MTRMIAEINGRKVYSNKIVRSIINTKISFADGSWCDVSTNEVVNKGEGYISFDVQQNEEQEKKTTIGPTTYQASSLDIYNLNADVNIEPTLGKEMTVTITGPDTDVDKIKVFAENGTLNITSADMGKQQGTFSGGISIIDRGANISVASNIKAKGDISIGNISISGRSVNIGNNRSDIKILVNVPHGSAIRIAGIQGYVVIGDIEGPLQASVVGSHDIKVGKIRDATLSLQGSGDIDIDAVYGKSLTINLQGSGDVRTKGVVGILIVNIVGRGNVHFGGKAKDANLAVVGRGNIYVTSVINRPQKSIVGRGEIRVSNWDD